MYKKNQSDTDVTNWLASLPNGRQLENKIPIPPLTVTANTSSGYRLALVVALVCIKHTDMNIHHC